MSKEITVTVEYGRKKKKEFNIYIVPNRFNVDFYEYTTLETKAKELNEIHKTSDSEKEKEDIIVTMENILQKKYDLIATIMIANDYIENKSDFDIDFWDKKVNPSDVESFLIKCFMKDKNPDEVKKKLKAMVS